MNKKKFLSVQWTHFCGLISKYDDLEIPTNDAIHNISMFLGKFAFDNAKSYREAAHWINKGVDAGRRWSLESYEEEEDALDI